MIQIPWPIHVRPENVGFRPLVPGKQIVKSESFPEGELITFDDGSEAVYPSLNTPKSDPDHVQFPTYRELFPNDPETHLDPEAFASRKPLCITPEVLRMRYPERSHSS